MQPASPRLRFRRLIVAYVLFAACAMPGILAFFFSGRLFPAPPYHPDTISPHGFAILVTVLRFGISAAILIPSLLLCVKWMSVILSPEELQWFKSQLNEH